MDYKVKETENKEIFETGAKRNIAEGRGSPSLLPFEAIKQLSIHMEKGAKVYGRGNYLKGMKISRYFDSAFRHLSDFAEYGFDSEENNLAAILFNICAIIETKKLIEQGKLPRELDDFPVKNDLTLSQLLKINETIKFYKDKMVETCK